MQITFPVSTLTLRATACAVLWCCGLMAGSVAHADERAEVERLRGTTLNLIKALVDSGLLSQEKAEQLLRQSEQGQAKPAAAPEPKPEAANEATKNGDKRNVIRVPYVPESMRQQMRDEIKQEVLQQARTERWGEPGALPGWARRISFEGDVRVRLQGEDWDSRNVSAAEDFGLAYQNEAASTSVLAWAPDLTNTQSRRARMTLRARAGLVSDLAFGFKTGMRLTTGSAQPASTSQTLGASNGQFSKYGVWLDRAWIQWTPYEPDVTMMAGRFASPYFSGDLIWPDDLNFDGVAVKAQQALGEDAKAYVNFGAFPLQEFQSDTYDSWLYGGQLGARLKLSPASQWEFGLGYYEFGHVEGEYDGRYSSEMNTSSNADKSYLATEYKKAVRQRGNTLMRINPYTSSSAQNASAVAPVWGLASKFKPVTLSVAFNYTGLADLHFRANADYIYNTGFDLADIQRRAMPGSNVDPAEKTRAWQVRAQLGTSKQELRGDWSAYLGWRRFERDAWLDAFTDTTWHMGGTNYTGWTLGGNYYVGPRTALGLRLTSTRNLSDGRTEVLPGSTLPVANLSSIRQRVDVIQIELNSRF
jgi:Putative porin